MTPEPRVQVLDEAVCISLCTNALEKDINPSLLSLYSQTDWGI